MRADYAHSVLTHLYLLFTHTDTSPAELHKLGRLVLRMQPPKDIPCASAALDLFGWLKLGFGRPIWVEAPGEFADLLGEADSEPEPDPPLPQEFVFKWQNDDHSWSIGQVRTPVDGDHAVSLPHGNPEAARVRPGSTVTCVGDFGPGETPDRRWDDLREIADFLVKVVRTTNCLDPSAVPRGGAVSVPPGALPGSYPMREYVRSTGEGWQDPVAFSHGLIPWCQYHPRTRTLRICIRPRGDVGSVWDYYEVPEGVFEDLAAAPSRGAKYNARIRRRFRGDKVTR